MRIIKSRTTTFAFLLGIAIATVTVQGQQIDEEALLERAVEICKPFLGDFMLPPNLNARERVLEGGVSPEWATETLEGMVRKNLSALEEAITKEGSANTQNRVSDTLRTAFSRAASPILMLRVIPGPKTLDLLREYALFDPSYAIRYCAVDSYIAIARGDSTYFLKEVIAKDPHSSGRVFWLIQLRIPELKKEGRDGDVAKLLAFLLEQAQTEQDWTAASALDKFLCSAIDGYAQSVQREQAVRRFIDSENESAREGFAEIKAAVDAVPADRRTDLGGRFTREGPDGGADGWQNSHGPVENKRAPWQLLSLIGVAAVGGVVMAWRYFRKRRKRE